MTQQSQVTSLTRRTSPTDDAMRLQGSRLLVDRIAFLKLRDLAVLVVDPDCLMVLSRAMGLQNESVDGRPDQESANKSRHFDVRRNRRLTGRHAKNGPLTGDTSMEPELCQKPRVVVENEVVGKRCVLLLRRWKPLTSLLG